jgi:hypothetical protein
LTVEDVLLDFADLKIGDKVGKDKELLYTGDFEFESVNVQTGWFFSVGGGTFTVFDREKISRKSTWNIHI